MASRRPREQQQRRRAEAAVAEIAEQMRSLVPLPWRIGDCTFGPSAYPEQQYGYATECSLGERIDFSIRADRAANPPSPDISREVATRPLGGSWLLCPFRRDILSCTLMTTLHPRDQHAIDLRSSASNRR